MRQSLETLLAPLAGAPGESALLLDVDGTLAPIVARPGDSRVPDAMRRELERLRDALAQQLDRSLVVTPRGVRVRETSARQ